MGAAAGSLALADEQAPAPARAPAPCASEEHRQFDFWVGEWAVVQANGKPAGRNTITAVHGGCALHESWKSAKGNFAGTSYNAYDAGREVWHQTWVDTSGLVLRLDGGWDGKRMVLEGDTIDKEGKTTRNQIAWEPLGDGRVRQTWSQSADGGKTWKVVFDGYYSRR
jgi:hypothetical protein